MPKPLYPFILLFLLSGQLLAQSLPKLTGARSAAVGDANSSLSDVWAIQNNIGTLAGIEHPELAFGFHSRLQLPELNTFGALLAWPFRQAAYGLSFSRFGSGAYSLQALGIGYSHQISYISLGIKLSYLQAAIEHIGSHGALVLEAGGKAALLPNLHFAAHAYNISMSRFSRQDTEAIPVLLKAGLSYLPTEKLMLHVQTFKDVEFPARFSAGLEYALIPEVQIRTGIQTMPVHAHFGLGLLLKKFTSNYAFQHHQPLGTKHHLSIAYRLSKLQKP